MTDHNLKFSNSSFSEQSSFKLLELPPELCKLMEASLGGETSTSLTIKGQPGEDAVLCTSNQTYTIRSVSLSNSILVVTSPPDSESSLEGEDSDVPDVLIRDQVNEILELTRIVPKLHKLNSLLRGREYGEDEEENDESMEVDGDIEPFTYADALATIQASETELNRGLREKRILQINRALRPISSTYLTSIIEYTLNTLVSLSLPHESASVEKLSDALAEQHDVPRTVSVQVMGWLGEMNEVEAKWKMDVDAVVREAGLGILKSRRHESVGKEEFLASWRHLVGDKFASSVSLGLLAGNYLSTTPGHYSDVETLKYFPISSLPVDPAPRFADLFLTRDRWKNKDIIPFLSDIAVDSKERDKLLLKYARSTTDAEGVWYTARAQYNG